MSYLILEKQNSLSHSCLVASSIEIPQGLEERVQNIDDVFVEQWNNFHNAREVIKTSIHHPIMKEWEQINKILTACENRVHDITHGDYFRAMSYGAMRIVNTRMTDVLNTVLPIKEFMEEAIKNHEENEKKSEKGEKFQRKNAKGNENLKLADDVLKVAGNNAKEQWILEKGGRMKRTGRWLFKRLFNIRPF